jgi:hypothetical protein
MMNTRRYGKRLFGIYSKLKKIDLNVGNNYGIYMRFYLSHSIRGKYGNQATQQQMQQNCQMACDIAMMIKDAIRPPIDIYVPGAHDEFVQIAYYKGFITESHILDVDCTIIDTCDAVLFYSPDGIICGGCKIEKDYAEATNKPVIVFADVEEAIEKIAQFILKV